MHIIRLIALIKLLKYLKYRQIVCECVFSFHKIKMKPINACVKLFAEAVGTAFLLFGGCIGELTFDGNPPSTYVAATVFGLVIMVIVQCIGHISGGHINPAVTLASVIFRMTSIPVLFHNRSTFESILNIYF